MRVQSPSVKNGTNGLCQLSQVRRHRSLIPVDLQDTSLWHAMAEVAEAAKLQMELGTRNEMLLSPGGPSYEGRR